MKYLIGHCIAHLVDQCTLIMGALCVYRLR